MIYFDDSYDPSRDDDRYDEYEPFDEYDDADRCICDGSGVRITCMDDMCANSDHCIHGDGEEICPVHF